MQTRYHTLTVAPADRTDYWRAAMADSLATTCSIEPARTGSFDASMLALPCGPLSLLEVRGSPFRTTRHGPGREGWVSLMVQLDGFTALSDGRRETCLSPGDACVVAADRDICVDRLSAFHQVLVNVPVGELQQALPDWNGLTLQSLDGSLPAVQALGNLVRFVVRHSPSLEAQALDHLGNTTLCLIDAVGALRRPPRSPAGPAAASATQRMRQRAERHIHDHLDDSTMSVASIAAGLGVSPRYLHRLFEGGPQVMQWVLEQRLQASREDLATRGTRPIADIAWACGFASPAHFSRAFKKRFGVPPSGV